MELLLAYIDPGSGSLVIQALIAGLVAIPVIFRRQIARIVGSIRGRGEPPPDSVEQDEPGRGA